MARSVQLLNDKRNYNFLALLSDDAKIEIENLSAFERFALFCDNLDKACASRLKDEFLRALSCDLQVDLPTHIRMDRECQKAVWRRINGDCEVNPDIAKICACELPQGFCAVDRATPISLDALLKSVDDSAISLDEFIAKVADFADISFELSVFVYVRPDEYHACRVFEKLRGAQKCSREELSLLKAWIICRALMQKNARLCFVLGDSAHELEALLRLLDERKLFPQISLCFDDVSLCEDISRICLEAEQKNISPEIISREMSVDDITFFVKSLSHNIPISRISLCGHLSAENAKDSFFAAVRSLIQAGGEK